MKLHNLKYAKGSITKRKRIGRGEGSGLGGTSTKGHKGGQSRTGYSAKNGFEGGQTKLIRKLPKFGFKNPTKVLFSILNLDTIQHLIDTNAGLTELNFAFYKKHRIITNTIKHVKILSRGELKAKGITIHANVFSAKAKTDIETSGNLMVTVEFKKPPMIKKKPAK